MNNIKQIFDEIASESSTNQKMEILKKYKNNELLKRVLYLANSKRIKFYIKQIPEYTTAILTYNLISALNSLELLSSRQLTGGAAITHLQSILSLSTPDDAYIIERIIEKDCKIGMGTSLINKVFGDLIEKTPYQGCKPFSPELVRKLVGKGKRAVSQLKVDGRYQNTIIRNGDVELETRQGEITILTGAAFLNELSKFEDCVLNGELTIPDMARYKSNGVIASLVSIGKKISEGENVDKEIKDFETENEIGYQHALDSIRYTVWDVISVDDYFKFKSELKYSERLAFLEAMIRRLDCKFVQLIETVEISSYEEAMAHFTKTLALGLEGTVVKDLDAVWKNGKHTHQIKIKLEMNVDLKIVGFNYGDVGTKNEFVISSFNAESSCGRVKTSPQGLKEVQMKHVTENQDKLLGTIIEVKCNGLSQDSKGNYSLLHPAFEKFRDDKDTCDSLESIMEIEAMVKGLTK